MPIKGLTDRNVPSFPKIGNIRKGAPKTNAKRPGADLTYFRYIPLEGEEAAAEKFHQVYGDEPRAINIFLPFDGIGRNFEAFMELHTASALQCQGDGETAFMWRDKRTGQMQHTPKPCPRPLCKGCKETGRLKIIVPELQRLAYVTVHTTSKWDIIELTANLEAIRKLTGNGLKGIPLILKRRPRTVSTPRENGKRVRQEKWLLSIEADPQWVKAQLEAMKIAALPSPAHALPQSAKEAETGEVVEEWDGELLETGEVAEDEAKELETSERPYSPYGVRYRLRHNAGWRKGDADDFSDGHRPPDDKQEPPDDRLVQRIAALMGKALKRDDAGDPALERHSVLKFAFGVDSTKLLTLKEAQATTKWLEFNPGMWIPSGEAAEECRLMLREALKEAGQAEMELDVETEEAPF